VICLDCEALIESAPAPAAPRKTQKRAPIRPTSPDKAAAGRKKAEAPSTRRGESRGRDETPTRQMHRDYNDARRKIEEELAGGTISPRTAAKKKREAFFALDRADRALERERAARASEDVDGATEAKRRRRHAAAAAGESTSRGPDSDAEDDADEPPPVKLQIGEPTEVTVLGHNRVLKSTYPNLFMRLSSVWSVFTSTLLLKNNGGALETVTIERRPPPESKKKPVSISIRMREIFKVMDALKIIIAGAKPPAPISKESILALEPDEFGWRTLGPSGFTQYPHHRFIIDGTWLETREVAWQTKGGGSQEALSIIRKESLNTGLKKDFSLDLPVYLTPALLACLEVIDFKCFRDRGEPDE